MMDNYKIYIAHKIKMNTPSELTLGAYHHSKANQENLICLTEYRLNKKFTLENARSIIGEFFDNVLAHQPRRHKYEDDAFTYITEYIDLDRNLCTYTEWNTYLVFISPENKNPYKHARLLFDLYNNTSHVMENILIGKYKSYINHE